ncbi:hypothetical protein CEJ86_28385 [Sinorhizobium meliloti]|uniref:AbrB family transcriptional regulator n=1 Tax=Rhizobium meliloti TaxID=382 RepID=A0A2J0YUT3_RHIML|nr:hypothetical protein CEJ86_28385 [Sinorhizobium meliloti]
MKPSKLKPDGAPHPPRSHLATRTSRSDRGWSSCRAAAQSDILTLRIGGHFNLAATTQFELPTAARAAAQVVIGATIGCRFAFVPPRKITEVIGLSFGSTILLLAGTLTFASILSCLTGDRFASLALAYSPGGVAEMSVIALSLGVEVPFVVLHHIVRLFLIVAGAGAVFRWVKR